MEVYLLDSLLRRERVIDRFESLIWTERFKEYGDFELIIRSTPQTRAFIQTGTRWAMNESYRVMTAETIEDTFDEDGKRVLKVRGNSLEALLEDRMAQDSFANLGTWDFTALPAAAARKVFHDICVAGVLDPLDRIPFIVESGELMPPSTISEPIDPIDWKLPIKTVGETIKDICNIWNLGFRLLRNFDASQIYWDVYAGSDRSSGQTLRSPVIFSPELDNLTNTTELTSIETSKNVAYVVTPDGTQQVYPRDVPADTGGFDRRVLIVDANDITLESVSGDTEKFNLAVLQRGQAELAKNQAFQAFDGEINPRSQYKYQRDYYLGDIVEQRNDDGYANLMRVTEQIFVSDKEGERTYPTLAKNTFVNTGSWLSEGTKTWLDYDADPITWSEKP